MNTYQRWDLDVSSSEQPEVEMTHSPPVSFGARLAEARDRQADGRTETPLVEVSSLPGP